MEEKNIRDKSNLVLDNLYKLSFGRILTISKKEDDIVKLFKYTPCLDVSENEGFFKTEEVSIHHDFTAEEYKKKYEFVYKKYYGYAILTGIDYNIRSRKIYFSSEDYHNFNTDNFKFESSKHQATDLNEGDLICGYIKSVKESKGFNCLIFSKWFHSSECFYRLHRVLLGCYENRKLNGIDPLRSYFMKGNKLATNTYKRWVIDCLSRGIKPSAEECEKRFYYIKTESSSKSWCHIYNAIFLLFMYSELPSQENIPTCSGEKCSKWIIPDNFIEKFLEAR